MATKVNPFTGALDYYEQSQALPPFRNKIINGLGLFGQRGTIFSTVNLVGSTFPYNLDRFCSGRANVVNNGHCTITQIASSGGQKHQITEASGTLSSGVYFTIRQNIEGLNCFDLAGKQVTVSFKVKTNKAGNYGVSLYDGTGSATITPQSITVSSSDASAANKVSYSKTFTMPSSITADNASRLRLDICLSAHSNRAGEYFPTGGSQVNLFDSTSNYFEIYEIQLEEGTSATSFEHRPVGTELSLCQRYFEKVQYSIGAVAGTVVNRGTRFPFRFAADKRATPSVTISSSATVRCSTPTGSEVYTTSVTLRTTNSNTDGDDYSAQGSFTASSEL